MLCLVGAPKAQERATLIVPYAAGGQIDTTARMFAERLGPLLGKTVVVDNRSGAGGAVGIGVLTQSPPDGNTMMIAGVGSYLLPMINKSIKYDADKQLRPVAQITSAPLLLIVRADSPYKNMAELLRGGHAKPLNFGSSGIGTTPQLAAVWLMAATKTPAVHIPYRGGPTLTQALLTGDVDFVIDVAPTALPLVKAGKLRSLGVTMPVEFPDLPHIPAISDSVPGYAVSSWLGIFLPGGTSDAVADKLESALKSICADPEIRARLKLAGNPVEFKGGRDFKTFVSDEASRYGTLIREQHISVE